ncbi:MAG: phosphotransferase enzyme family protein [Anaerolineales bacterium]
MGPDLSTIAERFDFEGEFISASPYGHGHINDTYAAEFNGDGAIRRYILQRINHHVFKKPSGLMDNIETVTTHLRQKITADGGDPERETLTLIPTVGGKCFLRTETGDYWRAYIFIENAKTYERIESLDHVYSAAWAFGNFQNMLSDLPANLLTETIPGFHNTKKRFETFLQVVDADDNNLAQTAKEEIEFVLGKGDQTSILVDLIEQGEIPERITHNDTKLNNVMIDDETGEGVCVIDLDTVMPGLSLYDFGDSIRSFANPAPEDERDLSNVQFDLEVFDRYTQGYMEAVRETLTPSEVEFLPLSAMLMTLECGIRFLADHLQGDTYFKTQRENHNLDRCRTQFKLAQSMEEQFEEMVRIIEKYK